MEEEGVCPKCGKKHCVCEAADEGMGYEDDESLHELLGQHEEEDEGYHAEDEGMGHEEEDEGYAVGTTITEPDGTAYKVTKQGGKAAGAMAEAKLRRAISLEVDRVLAEMSNSGDTGWMYPSGKRPATSSRGRTTLGFAGTGFKR